ncbi:MAG: LamG-like jellyroll fold domain-containing protein [Phycisphaerae bacterium]
MKNLLLTLALACLVTAGAKARILAWWDMNDAGAVADAYMPGCGDVEDAGTGTTADMRIGSYDLSGNGNHLSAWTDTWMRWSAEGPNGDFSMVSANNYPAAGTVSSINPYITGIDIETVTPATFTLEAVFRADASGNRGIIGRDDNTSNLAAIYFSQRSSNRFSFEFRDVAGVFHSLYTENDVIFQGNWYHVAGVSTGEMMYIYVDGVEVASMDISGTSADTSLAQGWGTWSLARGIYSGGHTDRFFGAIDSAAISDVALAPGSFVLNNGPINIDNLAPANGSTLVDRDSDIEWAINDTDIATVDVYFGAVSDPNLTVDATYQVLTGADATTVSFDPGTLDFDTTYYWKVIGYDAENNMIQGPIGQFTTVPETVVLSAVSPAFNTVDEAADVVLSVTASNTESYQWYKIGEPDVALVDGADYSGTTTAHLTVLGVDAAAEGAYYCSGTNAAGTVSNRDTGAGVVQLKRLVNAYTMEEVIEGVISDQAGNTNLTLTNITGGAALPSLAEGMPALSGASSLYFNNSDATDPNLTWGSAAQFDETIAENCEDITITMWFKWDGGDNWQRIFDIGTGIDDYMFLCANAAGTNLRYATRIGAGTEQVLNTALPAIGEWTYVAIVVGGDTGKMYINGEVVATNTAMTVDPTDFAHASSYLANSQYEADPYFNGSVDDMKIYNYALTVDEVAQDYVGVVGGYVCDMEANDLAYDLNNDCKVDLGDLSLLATEWLGSYRIYAN